MLNSPISIPLFGENFAIDPPSFFTIFGFRIHFYAIFVTLGFAMAGLYLYKRRDMLGLTTDNVLDLVIRAVIAGILGARLYYIIFNPTHYFGAGNWINIIRIRSGGLAIYGGIIGAGISFLVYCLRRKIPVGKALDAAAFGLFIGQMIGRWGNFFNREAYGIATDLPWRMGISTTQGFQYVHPIFIYEALWNLVGFIMLHVFSKKRKSKYPGQYFLMYLAWYGFGRFFIEGIRGPDTLLIHGTNIPVSQVVAALSCIGAIALLIYFLYRNRSPKLNLENLILEHGGHDNDDSDDLSGELPDDKKTIKKNRAKNIAKGKRAAAEHREECKKSAKKTRRITEIKRTKRTANK